MKWFGMYVQNECVDSNKYIYIYKSIVPLCFPCLHKFLNNGMHIIHPKEEAHV